MQGGRIQGRDPSFDGVDFSLNGFATFLRDYFFDTCRYHGAIEFFSECMRMNQCLYESGGEFVKKNES